MSEWWWNLYYNYPAIFAMLSWICDWWMYVIGGVYGAGVVGVLIGQARRHGFSLKGIDAALAWPLLIFWNPWAKQKTLPSSETPQIDSK